jgi:hypothetical protein
MANSRSFSEVLPACGKVRRISLLLGETRRLVAEPPDEEVVISPDLKNIKPDTRFAYWDQHPGSRSTQRQHLASVRLLFDSLMMRGVIEYNPAARARPPRLVRESSHTPVFEEAEIVALAWSRSASRLSASTSARASAVLSASPLRTRFGDHSLSILARAFHAHGFIGSEQGTRYFVR